MSCLVFGTFMTRKTNVQFGDFQWQFFLGGGRTSSWAVRPLSPLQGYLQTFPAQAGLFWGCRGTESSHVDVRVGVGVCFKKAEG